MESSTTSPPPAPFNLSAFSVVVGIHLAAAWTLWVYDLTVVSLALALISYAVRFLAVAIGYHRLIVHRSYEPTPCFFNVIVFLAVTTCQGSPLDWRRHHLDHHQYADRPGDPHTGRFRGFFWAHLLWLFFQPSRKSNIADAPPWLQRPLVRFLESTRFAALAPAAILIILLAGIGYVLEANGLDFGPGRCVGYGFAIPSVMAFHAIFAVNSMAHGYFGVRRFCTDDESRNLWFLALFNFGEFLHNNHHKFPSSASNEHGPGEIDLGYRFLRLFQRLGWIHRIRTRSESRRDGEQNGDNS